MMLAGFVFLLLLTGGSSDNSTKPLDDADQTEQVEGRSSDNSTEPLDDADQTEGVEDGSSECIARHVDLLNHLNLTNRVKFLMARPVKNHGDPVRVNIKLAEAVILDLQEKEQKIISYVWIEMLWGNEFIEWEPADFCGIHFLYVPTELLWKPHVFITEMTEKDTAFQTPHLFVFHTGKVTQINAVTLVSTCRMHFDKFPFDIQTCSLSFVPINDANTVVLEPYEIVEQGDATNKMIQFDSEWQIINVTFKKGDSHNGREGLIYTVTVRRRSVLHVVNFILPILFLLCLDLASFLISESGGEKLSFKVTILLAVTVMQLILNDFLPSSSDSIPLIVVYCMWTFGMMMLSLFETILVMYLMEKDKEAGKDQSLNEDYRDRQGKICLYFRDIHKLADCVRVRDSPSKMPSELLPMEKEGSSSRLTEESHESKNPSDELLMKMLALLLNSQKEERKPGYWTRMTTTINRIYLILYIITACLFLGCLFTVWFSV
ncbi:5-hydroxytryptamine receptor 3A-like [Cheilinus undulatus]|uniref:5-hydroxytryptamine receptor 3A-like n=1 Tax=Cheilinus undulatus TaxID=241271 RepID=UPI001BD1E45B|nr:5-hydroxytryptamine receptor 3A-like [Cheilinus undulatus]